MEISEKKKLLAQILTKVCGRSKCWNSTVIFKIKKVAHGSAMEAYYPHELIL